MPEEKARQKIRIEIPDSAHGTRILTEDGEHAVDPARTYGFVLSHNVNEVPKLTILQYAMESTVTGPAVLERKTICARCHEELQSEMQSKGTRHALLETSNFASDAAEWGMVERDA